MYLYIYIYIFSNREYFKERIRYEFKQNKNLQDKQRLNELLEKAKKNLEIIRRQVTYVYSIVLSEI